MIAHFRRFIACVLIVSLLPLPAQASLIATDAAARSEDRQRISSLLERADVQAQLQSYGVGADEVKARVAALTDDEAAELAARVESLPAGGVGVIGAILIVFLVLLLTDILGLTKIFPFTKPMR
jgi:hypothetical protein